MNFSFFFLFVFIVSIVSTLFKSSKYFLKKENFINCVRIAKMKCGIAKIQRGYKS